MNGSWGKVKKIHWDVKSSKIQSKCDDEITLVKKKKRSLIVDERTGKLQHRLVI